MLAFCGLLCEDCAIFKATQTNDPEQKKTIAANLSTEELPVTDRDIHCMGCFSTENIYLYCGQCEVRACAINKGIENCGHCDKYPCELLLVPFAYDEDNKTRLDEHRRLVCE